MAALPSARGMDTMPYVQAPAPVVDFHATTSQHMRIDAPSAIFPHMMFRESDTLALMDAAAPGGVGHMQSVTRKEQSLGFWRTRVEGRRLPGAYFEQARLICYIKYQNPLDRIIEEPLVVTADTVFNTLSYDTDGFGLDAPNDYLGQPVLPGEIINIRSATSEESKFMVRDLKALMDGGQRSAEILRGIKSALGIRQGDHDETALNVMVESVMTIGPAKLHGPYDMFDQIRTNEYLEEQITTCLRPILGEIWGPTPAADIIRRVANMLAFVGSTNTPGAAVTERNKSNLYPDKATPDVICKGVATIVNYWAGCTNLAPLTNLFLILHLAPNDCNLDAGQKYLEGMSRNPAFVQAALEVYAQDLIKSKKYSPSLAYEKAAEFVAHSFTGLLAPRLMLTPFANSDYPDPQHYPHFADVFMPNNMPCAIICVGQLNGSLIPMACRTEPYDGHRSYNPDWKHRTAQGNYYPSARRASGVTIGGDGSDRVGVYLHTCPSPDSIMTRWSMVYPA
jgi:hypothetical protein